MIFRNYLIWALRSIVHQKIYSFVNLASLVVAFTCTAFIVLVIANEVSYDTWIPDTDGVYLINSAFSIPHQQTMYSNGAPFPLAAAMSSRMPQLVAETHIMPYRMPVRVGGRSFSQTVDVVDPDFFRVFRLPLLAGRRKGALSSPNSVVLTQATARKLFGDGSALGKTLIQAIPCNRPRDQICEQHRNERLPKQQSCDIHSSGTKHFSHANFSGTSLCREHRHSVQAKARYKYSNADEKSEHFCLL